MSSLQMQEYHHLRGSKFFTTSSFQSKKPFVVGILYDRNG